MKLNPFTSMGNKSSQDDSHTDSQNFAESLALVDWPARSRYTGIHSSIFSHTQITTRANSLVYVLGKSGHSRERVCEDIGEPTHQLQLF